MATPESKAKDKLRRILKKHGCYFFFPPANGYGSTGISDVIGCKNGRLFAVEVKADTKVTALQQKNLDDIVLNGGKAFVVRLTKLGVATGYDEVEKFLKGE